MAERVTEERIKREKGYLYYLGKDGYLWRTPTKLNKSGTRARVGTEKIAREDGYMYFLDKEGRVSRAKMRDAPLAVNVPEDTFPRDATAVLRTIGKEVDRWLHEEYGTSAADEFAVSVSPVTGPGTHPAACQTAFSQVLRGLLDFNREERKKRPRSRISAIDVTQFDRARKTATHSFLLTGLPDKMYRGALSIASYQTYAFVRVATSGYPGTGPQVYAFLNGLLDAAHDEVNRVELEVHTDPLRRLFLLYGPTLWIRWPDLIYPPRREWEGEQGELMADRYSESELE